MNLFQGLNDRGITVIVVTHEREVASFARRTLEFRDGYLTGDHWVESSIASRISGGSEEQSLGEDTA